METPVVLKCNAKRTAGGAASLRRLHAGVSAIAIIRRRVPSMFRKRLRASETHGAHCALVATSSKSVFNRLMNARPPPFNSEAIAWTARPRRSEAQRRSVRTEDTENKAAPRDFSSARLELQVRRRRPSRKTQNLGGVRPSDLGFRNTA
jgi:hypothetical protein